MARFLSAKNLGLTEKRKKALVKTLKLFESGKVKYKEAVRAQFGPVKDGFNMAFYNYPCGTPACVAGWADHFLGRKFFVSAHINGRGIQRPLSAIFSDYVTPDKIGLNTPKKAAQYLREYLETGHAGHVLNEW